VGRSLESLLAEQGYEAATLKAIGERAGIPTASVYHYFAHRHEVDTELLKRHLGEIGARIAAALVSPRLRTLRDAVDAVIDPVVDYFREHPSLVELWFVGRQSATLAELGHAWDEATAEQLWHVLIDRHLLDRDTPQHVLRLAFEAGDRLFDVAFQRSPTGDRATIDEARRLVTAYLETYRFSSS
jgi:AcrR family transcriptional regulator